MWLLAFIMVTVVLLQLVVQYRLNLWNRDFFNGLEKRDGSALWSQSVLFLPLAVTSVVVSLFGVWGRMTAQRTWRAWLTEHVIGQWLDDNQFRRLKHAFGDHRNPEYRIAEDARVATDAPLDFALGLLALVLTGATFISVLWNVGGDIEVQAFASSLNLPGYLVIAATVYALVTTVSMLLVGRRLVRVIENKNEAEADFRSAASRLRENAESPQPTPHEAGDVAAMGAAFHRVIQYWRDLCWQLMRTTIVAASNALLAPVVSLILCAPKYLNGSMSLGEVTQAAAAFVTVQGAFNWLLDNYPRLADWASSANRVALLLVWLDRLDGAAIPVEPAPANDDVLERRHEPVA